MYRSHPSCTVRVTGQRLRPALSSVEPLSPLALDNGEQLKGGDSVLHIQNNHGRLIVNSVTFQEAFKRLIRTGKKEMARLVQTYLLVLENGMYIPPNYVAFFIPGSVLSSLPPSS